MSILDDVKQLLGYNWQSFNNFFKATLDSDVDLLNKVNNYLLEHSGKQLRPVLVLLSASICAKCGQQSLVAATAIEMVHTATLLHDDVVDNAEQRRGTASVKKMWQSNIAVLTGDYLLSKAFQTMIGNNELRLLPWFNRCMLAMSEGELWQLEKSQKLDISEGEYFHIIGKKTAVLMALSMACGAITADVPETLVQRMYDIGYTMGMAFQIRDDIFDYECNNKAGKHAGNDIREQKITLPLLYALRQTDNTDRIKTLKHIRRAVKKSRSVSKVIDLVHRYKGLEYAENVMLDYSRKAAAMVMELPDSEYRKALTDLTVYMTTRKK